ncbi:MAG: DUF285 domain-containing protein, partial [Thaumarchaeota archaeon]|nr:DUF285 domain-containing protein [Nitrososphaerota archaeon]
MYAIAYAVLLAGLAASTALLLPFAHTSEWTDAVRYAPLPGQFVEAHAQQAPDQRPFVTTWKIDATQTITIPLWGTGMTIYWGDGTNSTGVAGTATHTYANRGTYEVSVYGDLKAISLDGHPDAAKLVSIDQWGDVSWITMNSAFEGAANMVYRATDTPDLSSVTDMSDMFVGATSFDSDISSWDVSSVTYMWYMFYGATSFNQPLDTWNVSSVTDMSGMFSGADSFNQPLDTWDVSSVTGMSSMFSATDSFNQPLDTWDVSSVTDMSHMFLGATSFNQPLDTWDVSSVTRMDSMFTHVNSFNQNLGSWYITLNDLDISNDERTVGSIVSQNHILANHNPVYDVTGAHADLFEVVDHTTLRLKPGQNVTLGTT